jgi:hypothetical protein
LAVPQRPRARVADEVTPARARPAARLGAASGSITGPNLALHVLHATTPRQSHTCTLSHNAAWPRAISNTFKSAAA